MPQSDHPYRDRHGGTGSGTGQPCPPYRYAADQPAAEPPAVLHPAGHPDPAGDGPAPSTPGVRDAREDGLRRLSTLTVAAAVAAVAATGVVAAAAHHASSPTSDPAAPVSAGTDQTDPGGGLRGPAEAPRRADRPPAGVSSGS